MCWLGAKVGSRCTCSGQPLGGSGQYTILARLITAAPLPLPTPLQVPGLYQNVRPNMLRSALQRMQNCSDFSLEG